MTGHKNAERGKYVGFTLNQVFGDGIEEEFGGRALCSMREAALLIQADCDQASRPADLCCGTKSTVAYGIKSWAKQLMPHPEGVGNEKKRLAQTTAKLRRIESLYSSLLTLLTSPNRPAAPLLVLRRTLELATPPIVRAATQPYNE